MLGIRYCYNAGYVNFFLSVCYVNSWLTTRGKLKVDSEVSLMESHVCLQIL